MVKVKIQELGPRRCRLLIEESRPYFVNSLRRVLMAEVPKLAVQDVIIYDNNSGLFDEMVSHRIGLLPIPTDLNVLNFRDACTCDAQGCPSCTVRFTLSKEGPGMVVSGDLQPEDPKFAIADPDIPVVELLKGQRIILEAEAILGRGRDHAKWQICSGVGYRYVPSVKRSPATEEKLRDVARKSPADAHLAKGDLFDADGILRLSPAGIQAAQAAGIGLEWDETRFEFRFETDGSLSAKDALVRAIDIMKGRLDEFEQKLDKVKVEEPAPLV